jgi:hypothetical protein
MLEPWTEIVVGVESGVAVGTAGQMHVMQPLRAVRRAVIAGFLNAM